MRHGTSTYSAGGRSVESMRDGRQLEERVLGQVGLRTEVGGALGVLQREAELVEERL